MASYWTPSSKDSAESKCVDSPTDSSNTDAFYVTKEAASSGMKNLNKTKKSSVDNDMTELVKLQTSSGMFEITANGWKTSVFETYLGKFQEVKESCPEGTELNAWLTSLAMKILELKMGEKKDLWELVAEKSKKFLLSQLLNNEEEYNKLQEKAEEYITKQKGQK